MQNSDLLKVLEDKSEFGSDAFALLDYMLPMYFYLIASTNSQSFAEDGRHYHSLEFKSQAYHGTFDSKELPNSLAYIGGEFKHMFWEHDPLLPKRKIPQNI